MNDTMAIRRSCEEGMYLLREGDCLCRVNEDGVDAHFQKTAILSIIQQSHTAKNPYQWRSPLLIFSSKINRLNDSLLADSQQNLFGIMVALLIEPRTDQRRLTE